MPGNDGATGPAGPQGDQGNPGATGPQGIPGNDGVDGLDGATGPTGPQGDQGDPGAAGPQGMPGNDGATGRAGADGATGPAGPQGPAGADGATGPSISNSIIRINQDITLTEEHHTVIMTGGRPDIILPRASSCMGRIYFIKNYSGNDTNISTYVNMKGDTKTELKDERGYVFQSDGIEWQQLLKE
ncbi:MAG: hypothetical protein V7734_12955, partial [Maribacter arcticus]